MYSSQLLFLAPSSWIASEAKLSKVMSAANIVTINNIHEHFPYFSVNSHSRRNKQNCTLGVASMDKNSWIKGGDVVQNVINFAHTKDYPISIKYLSDFTEKGGSAKKFWECIDFLLVPSRIDNSPNVIHEAKLMGIPVIATNVGGIPELLDPSFDFILDFNNQLTEEIILIALNYANNKKYAGGSIIQKTYQNSNFDLISKYIEVYKKLI
jgi:glycosyltransferase involved in cell wall biosynthesis